MLLDKFRLEDLRAVAKELLAVSAEHTIWSFKGEMGAGKTTLIKSICGALGAQDDMSSPTFSIVNEYVLSDGDSIYHFDFYRIEHEYEAVDIGAEEYFDSGSYCFIEWPERIERLIPEKHLEINIILVDELTRSIRLKST